MNCGFRCLKIIVDYYGKGLSLAEIGLRSNITSTEISMFDLGAVAKKLGFHTLPIKIQFENLANDVSFPFIAFWNSSHYVVVFGIDEDTVYIEDPSYGKRNISHKEFCKSWINSIYKGKSSGIALLFEKIHEIPTQS